MFQQLKPWFGLKMLTPVGATGSCYSGESEEDGGRGDEVVISIERIQTHVPQSSPRETGAHGKDVECSTSCVHEETRPHGSATLHHLQAQDSRVWETCEEIRVHRVVGGHRQLQPSQLSGPRWLWLRVQRHFARGPADCCETAQDCELPRRPRVLCGGRGSQLRATSEPCDTYWVLRREPQTAPGL